MITGLDAIKGLEHALDDPGPDAFIKTVGDSNIVITFLAWMDQTQSDFEKMRSLAIKVAKDALEEGGFTLPEPLYRVRIDDRGGQHALTPPESFRASAAQSAAGRLEEKAAGEARGETVLDVSPDKHIEEMVNSERLKSGDLDLLDSDRPVE